jgi:hypothetical protein
VFTKNLRVLQQSGAVPPAVILFRKGKPDQATVDRIRSGLLKVQDYQRGRLLLTLWNIDAFETASKDYAARLDAVQKEFPAPVNLK